MKIVKNHLVALTLTLVITTTLMAKEVIIPQNDINLFVGSFSELEAELKAKIFKKALEQCGSIENVSIGHTEITLKLGNIYNHTVTGNDDTVIQGAYPTVGAKVNIACHRPLE